MSDELRSQEPDRLPPIEELAERLLDAAAVGRFSEELTQATAMLEELLDQIEPDELFRYRVLFFDLALVSTSDRWIQASTAIDMLSSTEGDAWDALLRTTRIDELRRLTDDPDLGLELIELLTYAPNADIRDSATSQLEAVGIQRLSSGHDVRSIERLLHAAGASEAAYRLEAARKQRNQLDLAALAKPVSPDAGLPYGVIAIVGGHAQLRANASALLEPYGVTVVSIPSSREAVRRERGILQALQGCDLAMLLVRQITHSTSDQVRKAAERLGIPVMFSNAASAVAIERQLLERRRMSSGG